MIGKFFLLAYTFGPAAAIPYAMSSMAHVNLLLIFLVLLIAYTAPLPIIFLILDKFHYSSVAKKSVFQRLIGKQVEAAKDQKMMNNVYKSFVETWGYKGFYMALFTMTFAFGFLWSALIAYLLKLPRVRSYVAIGFGNLVGTLFWIFISVQTKAFIKPKWVIIIVILATVTLFLYGEIRERKVLKKIAEANKDTLSKIQETAEKQLKI